MKNHITRFLPITTGLGIQFLILAIMLANGPYRPINTHFLLHNLLLNIFSPFSAALPWFF